jgi:Flp pilus assembly protein TadG
LNSFLGAFPNLSVLSSALWRDDSGVVLIYISLIMPILIGFTALGAEVGYWYVIKRQMQSAADSAAMSGAISLVNDGTSQYTIQADYIAGLNGFRTGSIM